MLNAVPVVSGQALLLFRKDRSSTLDAQTARAQEQDRCSWSPSLQGPGQVARGRTLVQGLHLLSHPFFPLEPAFPWACKRRRKEEKEGRVGVLRITWTWEMNSWEELTWGPQGGTEPCGEHNVSLVFAGPVCCLAPLSIPTSFGKSARHRWGGNAVTAPETWEEALLLKSDVGLCKLPSQPLSAILPSRQHTRPVAPHTGRPGEAGACAFAPGQCGTVHDAWPFHSV